MSGRLVGLLAGTLLVTGPTFAYAQREASLGFGIGTVRFPGGSSFGVFSLGPSLRIAGIGTDIALSGTLAALPRGDAYAQGLIAARRMTSPFAGRWRLAAEGLLSGVTSGRGDGSGSGELMLEALWATPRGGLGLATGPASGWILHAAPVTTWRARLRGWWQGGPGRMQVNGSVEPTWFLGAWFTDVGTELAVRRGRLEARVGVMARLSDTYASKGAALAAVDLRLSPTMSFEAVGGNVLPDPYQGLPASGFLTFGGRVHFAASAPARRDIVRTRAFRALRRDGEVLVRLRRQDAQVVTIAGDWTGWSPVPLTLVRGDVWEGSFPLALGPHQFVVFVDGATWQIPEGVPSVPDGMGGRVAVLTVF